MGYGRIVLLVALVLGPATTPAKALANTVSPPTNLSMAIADILVPKICDQNLVLLGELPSHGERITHVTKAEIVRRLVRDCEFKGVIFESGIYEFITVMEAPDMPELNQSSLDNAIGGFWRSQDLTAFRSFLLHRVQNDNLYLSGMDDQPSASSVLTKQRLPDLVAAHQPDQEAKTCQLAIERHFGWQYDQSHPYDAAEKTTLARCTEMAISRTQQSQTYALPLFRNFLSYMQRQMDSSRSREQVLAENLLWHRNRLPENSKIVVWTATVHAAEAPLPNGKLPMGYLLKQQLQQPVTSIGFTALTGSTAMAGRPPEPLRMMDPESLEAKSLGDGQHYHVLDSSQLSNMTMTPSRLLGRTYTTDWAALFDIVVVIAEEQAPTF